MHQHPVRPRPRPRARGAARIAAALAAILALAAGPLAAQNPQQGRPPAGPPAAGPGEIRGVVVDAESGTPVAAASVAVWSRADSALVAGAIAGPNGTFRIQGLRPGTYYLRVSMLGYSNLSTADLTIAAASPRADAGRISLARSAIALEGVSGTAERASVGIAPDRNTYQARTVAPAAANASEILENVPSVQVDADGRVSLRGNENVVVQINGRPSPIRGEQLAGYLKQLPANTIERVEVIPNPSARQDPEGMAGIINIVMKQNVDLGVSGGLTLGASTADRYTASGNLGYQRGRATLFTTFGYTFEERQVQGVNDRTRLALGSPLSFTEQDLRGIMDNQGYNATATLDYRLSERDVLSTGLTMNNWGSGDESLIGYTELDAGYVPVDVYERVHDSDEDNFLIDGTLGFRRTLVPQKHELNAEVRFNHAQDGDRTDLWRQPTGGGPAVEIEINDTDTRTREAVAQLDYTRTFAEKTKLETGYKGTARWLDRDFEVLKDSLGTGTFIRSDLSNALEFDETVNAVYGVLSHSTGKFELQGGLRAEYAARDFSLANEEGSYPYDYTSLFPSGLVAYNLTDNSQVKLSYSRRIRRPGSFELNPFPNFFDLQNVFLGNPELSPEYTDAVEASYQRSGRLGSIQFSPFYRRTTDIIRFIVNTADTVAGREVTSVSFENLDTGSSWGADLNGSLRMGQKFNGFAAFNVFKMVTSGGGGEASLGSDAVTWNTRFNGTYNLSPRTSFSASFFYRAPMNIEGGKFDSFAFANVSVRQKLMGERASFTVRLSDPFKTQRFRVEAGDDNVIQLTERRFNARALHLTFQYNFGQAPRIRQRPQEQQPQPAAPFGGR